jgi:hypothetical protein
MIKKLRNQPYAPKVGANPQMGARGSKKKKVVSNGMIIIHHVMRRICGIQYIVPLSKQEAVKAHRCTGHETTLHEC